MDDQLQSDLNILALKTKLNHDSLLTFQYIALAQKHGVKLTFEESKTALKKLNYIG